MRFLLVNEQKEPCVSIQLTLTYCRARPVTHV